VRQLLTESVLLAVVGGVCGLVLARAGIEALAPVPVPLDPVVLLFLLAVSLITGVAFGLLPALQSLRGDHNSVIRSGRKAVAGAVVPRSAMVVVELALAMMLVAGAAILLKSFATLMRVDPGFEPRGLLTIRLSIPPSLALRLRSG